MFHIQVQLQHDFLMAKRRWILKCWRCPTIQIVGRKILQKTQASGLQFIEAYPEINGWMEMNGCWKTLHCFSHLQRILHSTTVVTMTISNFAWALWLRIVYRRSFLFIDSYKSQILSVRFTDSHQISSNWTHPLHKAMEVPALSEDSPWLCRGTISTTVDVSFVYQSYWKRSQKRSERNEANFQHQDKSYGLMGLLRSFEAYGTTWKEVLQCFTMQRACPREGTAGKVCAGARLMTLLGQSPELGLPWYPQMVLWGLNDATCTEDSG